MKSAMILVSLSLTLNFLLTTPLQAQTNKQNLNLPEIKLLDKWECGNEHVCAVGIDVDGNIFLLVGDRGGVKMIFHKGQTIWERNKEKRNDL